MIEIAVRGSQLELEGYSTDATVAELWRALEAKRRAPRLKTVSCYDCGECCHDPVPLLGYDVARLAAEADVSPADFVQLPEPPDLVQHGRTIRDLQRQHRLSEREATLLYEHNTGDPPLLAKKAAGGCVFLVGRLCSIYAARPFICQL